MPQTSAFPALRGLGPSVGWPDETRGGTLPALLRGAHVELYDIAVIGGGIVGAAVAAEVVARRSGARVALVEKEATLAAHQSGHNSGVIHSGTYYKPGSLKARLCVEGAERMRRYCREHGIPLAEVGKLIVATREAELPRLDELLRRARANGVEGVERVDADRLRAIEPHARGVAALHLPRVSVTDFAAVARALAEDVRHAGGDLRLGTRVLSLRRDSDAVVVETTQGALRAREVVACAGLHSDRLALASGDAPPARVVPFRGEYHLLARGDLVRGLVYPVPDPRLPFLGVHFTRRVDGSIDVGPNAVLALAREGYARRDVDLRDLAEMLGWGGFWRMAARHARAGAEEAWRAVARGRLLADLRRLVPGVREEDLLPGPSGVRAQAVDARGALVDDFLLLRRDRVLHVLNAPSPAATASLAIARHVVGTLAM